MTTKVVHVRKAHYDVYIGRPSQWGNPFAIGRDGDRATVIIKYGRWLESNPELMAQVKTLKDKTLGCWCKPQACHGDILARLADAE